MFYVTRVNFSSLCNSDCNVTICNICIDLTVSQKLVFSSQACIYSLYHFLFAGWCTAYCCFVFFIVNVECIVFVNGWKIQQLKCMMSLKQHLVNGYWKLKKLMGVFFVRVILQSLGVLFPVEFLMNLNVLHKIMIFLWRLGRPYESVLDREKTSVVYYVWNWIVT